MMDKHLVKTWDVLYARNEVAYALNQLSELDHLTHDMEIFTVEHDMLSSWTKERYLHGTLEYRRYLH
jgi:hypothetical protein